MFEESLYQMFGEKVDLLSAAEKQVFFYIDNHIETVYHMSLMEVAEKNNVSTTTVIRMCQKLGLKGFSQLKYLLEPTKKEVVAPSTIVQGYSEELIEGVRSLDQNQILKLVKLIEKASKIHIACLGMTKNVGEYFYKNLVRKKRNIFFTYDSFIIDSMTQLTQPGDLVIIISDTGNTRTLVDLSDHLKFSYVDTVAIVNNPHAKIAANTTFTIYTSKHQLDETRYYYHQSLLLVVIDIILNTYIQRNRP